MKGLEPPLLTKEQLVELEKAATSLLTDNEICVSMDITEEALYRHYNIVEKARIKIKQKLNTKKLQEVAAGAIKAQDVVDSIPRNNVLASRYRPARGGPRPNSGPKPGTTYKISGKDILKEIENKTGKTFTENFVEGYMDAIEDRDTILRFKYEQMLINKVVADKAPDLEEKDKDGMLARIEELLKKTKNESK
jgi:hypothetical protein